MAKSAQYEVWCSHCNVSFPVGTKRCLHCGARTGERPQVARHTGMRDADLQPEEIRFPSYEEEPEEEVETRSRGVLRILSNVVWVLIFLGFWLVRACSDGEGASLH